MDTIGVLNEENILVFLIQMLVLLALARGLGELFRRYGQPAIAAEVLVGVLAGPTVLGRVSPQLFEHLFPPGVAQQAALETVSWVGVLFLLLSSGLDVDISMAWKQRRNSSTIAFSDIIIPFVLAFLAAFLIPRNYLPPGAGIIISAAFVGTALTISDLPVALRALHDLKILKTDMGLLILSALTINDIVGWLVFTLILGAAVGTGTAAGAVITFAGTIAFAAFCLTLGRRLVDRGLMLLRKVDAPQPGTSLTFVVLVGLLCGAFTQALGIHALFGFFLAGIMAGGSGAMSERSREIIDQMVHSIFVPLFFVGIGLRVDFLEGFDPLLVLGLTVVGIGGRFMGAYLGSMKSDIAPPDRMPVAIAHTPGGAMQVVVALLALEIGLIGLPVFVAIIFGAVASSTIVGPWMAWSLKRRRKISVQSFFMPQRFVMELQADAPLGAIRELSESLAREDGMPPAETILDAVASREKMMSTGIGSGAACPHARMPSVDNPRVVLGRSLAGIPWDSPDGQPVHLVFMILTPAADVESQVTILEAIARMLLIPDARKQLIEAAHSDDAWRLLRKNLQAKTEVSDE